ncbi:MAG: methionyl-tRNA formyltransferase [Candidatus Neomarinimicrobiota bacterium]
MRTVFMGNPNFAIPTLKAINQSKHELIAVVANSPKKMGRGRNHSYTPVGQFSKDNGIKLLEPDSLSTDEFKNSLYALKPDIFIVVAYKILPKKIIQIPFHGAINLHASLLPKYRGAGPIQWALMNGDEETGVTIFQIRSRVDTGDILLQKEIKICKEDDMLSLGTRLCNHGATMIIKILDDIDSGMPLKPIKQDSSLATSAPKINKEMTYVQWEWPSKKIHNWVRGLSPYPGMSTLYKGKRLSIYKTFTIDEDSMRPGSVISARDNQLIVSTGKGALGILELQLEGKKKMKINDFLRGVDIQSGEFLGK